MAEAQAGQGNAQQVEQQGAEQQHARVEGEGGEQQEKQEAGRTYTQAELDRILGKVRKNARYLGRKEAEAELVSRGATRQEAEKTVDRQQEQQAQPPKRESFESYEDYLDARADFRARNATRDERAAQDKADRERRVSDERQRIDREFAKHAKAAIAKHPEIAEAIESADDVQMSETMGDAVKEAGEIGIHILHYLVEHPEEAARISALESKNAQTREIGKLEARIEAELKAKAKPKKEEGEEQEGEAREEESAEDKGEGKDAERDGDGRFKAQEKGSRKAPDPIEPGTGRSANQDRGPNDKDSDAGWFAKRVAQERAERDRQRRK